jgi:hypothetical protein
VRRSIFDPEHEAFRDLLQTFLDRQVRPYHEKGEEDRIVPRGRWPPRLGV